jgi:hypothetical protein
MNVDIDRLKALIKELRDRELEENMRAVSFGHMPEMTSICIMAHAMA